MCRACGTAVRRSAREARAAPLHAFRSRSLRDLQLAGMVSRFIALTVDDAIVAMLSWSLSVRYHLYPDVRSMFGSDNPDGLLGLFGNTNIAQMMVWGAVIGASYSTVLLSISGRTIGAALTGIKVVHSDGGTVLPPAAFIRSVVPYTGSLVYAVGVFGGVPAALIASQFIGPAIELGYTMALWDEHRQTLHDRIAGTYVVSVGWFGVRVTGNGQRVTADDYLSPLPVARYPLPRASLCA